MIADEKHFNKRPNYTEIKIQSQTSDINIKDNVHVNNSLTSKKKYP